MKKLFFLAALLLAVGAVSMQYVARAQKPKERPAAIAPFISGDNFRALCNHIFDETQRSFDPQAVQRGDTVFVSGVYLDAFFDTVHPRIQHPYILVTHNCDRSVPHSHTAMGEYPRRDFSLFLDDPKIVAWFGQNVDCRHPKLIPLPIGLQNEHWGSKYPEKISKVTQSNRGFEKKHLLYGNFRVGTSNPQERQPIYDYFKKQPYCYFATERKDLDEYLVDVAESKFVLSPPGNGEDCHRTWEALYVGSYPIVRHSALDQLFADLPVVLINDWHEITEPFLAEKYEELECNRSRGVYAMEKITFAYWADLINAQQQACRGCP